MLIAEVSAVQQLLRDRSATVAVAESLTGGLVCAALTTPAGSSEVVRGGVVVYATDLKQRLAAVDPDLLAARGAVDLEVAAQLARGVRERLSADYGVGVTGVAGPDPQDGQPVGTVYAAVAGPDRDWTAAAMLDGDRAGIRAAAVHLCLGLLADALTSE